MFKKNAENVKYNAKNFIAITSFKTIKTYDTKSIVIS